MNTMLEMLERRPPLTLPPHAQPLAAALAKLEIEPFSAASVACYKNQKLGDTVQRERQRLHDQGWVTDTCGFDQYYDDVRNDLGPRWKDDDCYLFLARDFQGPRCFAFGWHRAAFAFAPQSAVPEFAQRKAKQILNEVPNVSFETDTLESENTSYDPFLIAKLGDEEYYFEVWEEAQFA
jgi:hypothetical protein